MSVEIVLVPLAVAAISAWRASRAETDETGRTVCHVSTRMRDQGLLSAALRDTGAVVNARDGQLVGTWAGVEAVFTLGADGIWTAHLTGEVDEERALSIVQAVDQAYGRQVQAAVLDRLRQRAPGAGMRVESESIDEDDTIVLTLALQAGAS
ncbi:MAG: hypothetical protein ACRDPJ_00425 [Nocardioidaceae bacterium]